jgi:hypothetical protein
MGIKLSPCEYVDGEKDWVYGVKYRGKNIFGGDRIPIGAELTLQIGSGQFSDSPEIETDTTNIENEVDSDLYEEESFGFDDLF